MLNETHLMRQLDLLPMESLKEEITIIGAGAIGSFTAFSLAKMGFDNLTVYDFDRVSEENMNCQWFRLKDIGKPKTEALRELVYDFTGNMIKIKDRFDGHQELSGLVISAVDSMAVRKLIWERVKGNYKVRFLIDPRMASEYALTFVMRPNDYKDQKSYEKTLYTDENSVEEPCTAKAIMYSATMISGYVAKHVKDIVTGSNYARVTHWNIGKNAYMSWPEKMDDVQGEKEFMEKAIENNQHA